MSEFKKARLTRTKIAVSIALAFSAISGSAYAVNIDTGNQDVELRWDNTVRYNGGWRMEKINPAFYNSPGYDETTGRVNRGEMVTNRIDLISEIDMVYQGKYGFRVSGAAWADGAYGSHSIRNTALPVSGAYRNDTFNNYTKRYIVGPSGEILDAFVFGTFDLDGKSLNLKAGQHNVYWGESLYSVTNSIAYSQGAVDSIKSATSPGAEAKELFLPRKQISGQMQLSDNLSIGAQYAFSWKPFRLAPGGTYFSGSDGTRSDFAATTPGFNIPNGPDLGPDSQRGDLGFNVRWSPAWLNGTAGFYYRKFDEKLPWSFTQLAGAAPAAIRLAYARDTELYGFSLTKTLNTVSVAAELSYRKNTALNSTSGYAVLPANGTSPTYVEAEGARGNTLHGLINGVYLLPSTALWQGGTLQGEFNFSHLMSVTKNANRFFGEGYACPAGRDKTDGCATKNAYGVNFAFTPAWPQAFAGWDLSMPTTLAYQLKGNGAALGGGNEDTMSWSIGLAGTLYSRYEFSLKYADVKVRYKTNPATALVSTANGSNAVQNDHGWLFFTFKTTF